MPNGVDNRTDGITRERDQRAEREQHHHERGEEMRQPSHPGALPFQFTHGPVNGITRGTARERSTHPAGCFHEWTLLAGMPQAPSEQLGAETTSPQLALAAVLASGLFGSLGELLRILCRFA